ncbi:MAG: LysR family transcriptional regulator [Eubacteriales bacterium]|nr:LysR family transcriptional regulator [Eubacteriales bacterium]
MNTRYLNYILTIAREGSFSKAAKKLGISHVALSNYLNQYEAELGIPLFDRSQFPYLPTEAGRIYIEAAREILEVQRITAQEIKNRTAGYSEQITLGVTPQRGDDVILRLFSDFHSHFPNVWLKTYNCYPQDGKRLLLEGKVDCLLGGLTEKDEKMFHICHKWLEEIFLILPDYLAGTAEKQLSYGNITGVDIRKYWDAVYVLYNQGTGARHAIDQLFRQAGFRPNIIYETNNPQVILQLIRKGMGIGFLPAFYTEQFCQDMNVRSLDPPVYAAQGVICRKDQEFSPAFQYLVAQLSAK